LGVADSRYESTFRLKLQNSPSSGLIAIGKSLIHTSIQQRQKYQVSVKYQTLHKQVHYRMKAKLKVPRRFSNKKDASAAIK
jgi:hypothetical protein